jgi:hypothetical protein
MKQVWKKWMAVNEWKRRKFDMEVEAKIVDKCTQRSLSSTGRVEADTWRKVLQLPNRVSLTSCAQSWTGSLNLRCFTVFDVFMISKIFRPESWYYWFHLASKNIVDTLVILSGERFENCTRCRKTC